MKLKANIGVLLFVVITMLSGCAAIKSGANAIKSGAIAIFTEHGRETSRAEKAYKQRDYYNAVLNSVAALHAKPDYEKAQQLLIKAFDSAVLMYQINLSRLEASRSLDNISLTVLEYEALQRIHTAVKGLPQIVDIVTNQQITFQTEDYSEQISTSKNTAALAYYQEGKKLGDVGGMKSSRLAATHMTKAASYVPNYKDSLELYGRFKRAGTKRIAIIPFSNSGDQKQHDRIAKSIAAHISAAISKDSGEMEFIEITSHEELSKVITEHGLEGKRWALSKEDAVKIGQALSVHELVFGEVKIVINAAKETEKTMRKRVEIEIERETRIGTAIVTRKDRKKGKESSWSKKLLGKAFDSAIEEATNTITVSADIAFTEISAGAEVSGTYSVLHVKNGALTQSDPVTGKYNFSHKWGTFSGDERALSPHEKQIVRNQAQPLPSEENVVNQASIKFADTVLENLKPKMFSIEGY